AAAGVPAGMVAGARVGAPNAAYYAGSPTPDGVERLEKIWLGVRRRDVFPVTWRSGHRRADRARRREHERLDRRRRPDATRNPPSDEQPQARLRTLLARAPVRGERARHHFPLDVVGDAPAGPGDEALDLAFGLALARFVDGI